MKTVINNPNDDNLIVDCWEASTKGTVCIWSHVVAPNGSLDCHINDNQVLEIYKELDYKNE